MVFQKCQQNNKALQLECVLGIAKGVSLQLMSGSCYFKRMVEA